MCYLEYTKFCKRSLVFVSVTSLRYTITKMKTLKPKKNSQVIRKSAKKPLKKFAFPSISHWTNSFPDWLQKILHSRITKLVFVAILVWYIAMWSAGWLLNFIPFTPVKDPNFGVSFSIKQTRELGVDPHANLDALLTDMGIKNYRLMSYWDEVEKSRGQFDFTELDWEVNEVGKHGGTVSLAIGLRQPRWPECHAPTWSYDLKGNTWKQALYAFMESVVKRYENNSTVISWQLENEAYNSSFGTCGAVDVQRLNEEFNLVKQWSTKPVWMSLSDQHSYPTGSPTPDRYGFSVYRWVYNTNLPPGNTYLLYPTPTWYHRVRAAIIKSYTHRDIFIHEMQLEPWGPTATQNLSVTEQNKSMSLQQIHDSIEYTRQIGMKDIYLWGGEWWYWRKANGDPTVWEKVKYEIHQN